MTIDKNKRDIAITLTKGVVGATPWVGSLVAGVIDTLIPNQRVDRIVDYFRSKLDNEPA